MAGPFQCPRLEGAISMLHGCLGRVAADLHHPVSEIDRDSDFLRDVSTTSATNTIRVYLYLV